MGLEGAVRLGFRRELEAVEDRTEREALFESMVERAYQHGKALNVATAFEIDDVIDPADSRRRIVEALRAAPPPPATDRQEAELHRHLVTGPSASWIRWSGALVRAGPVHPVPAVDEHRRARRGTRSAG